MSPLNNMKWFLRKNVKNDLLIELSAGWLSKIDHFSYTFCSSRKIMLNIDL